MKVKNSKTGGNIAYGLDKNCCTYLIQSILNKCIQGLQLGNIKTKVGSQLDMVMLQT